ncbi:MAG: hypothetical protein JWP01_2532 [Myxococcales bacterium]|nr:hypothetical protein [Myxococcales bacterium]
MTVAAGWYPDPQQSSLLRWWDGSAWTPKVARLGPEPDVRTQAPAVDPAIRAAAIAELDALQLKLKQLRAENFELSRQIVQTSNTMLLQEVGIYQFAHPLDDAPAYKERLDQLEEQYGAVIKAGGAVSTTQKWAVNGSEKEGAKMVADLAKLMLRTYNSEAENVIKKLKPHTLDTAIARLDKLRATIAKLGASMKLAITPAYHELRLKELRLTADFRQKEEDERERLRAQRERFKDEEKARKEQEAEQERLETLLDKERQQYENAIASLEARGDHAAIEMRQQRLAEIQQMLDGAIARAANLRAGFVYVISNVGAFGEGVVKIGLTRRLEPYERIRELHNASVPFRFDVHAVVFSEDAVGLESALHRAFEDHRVNLTNTHKEFFMVTPTAAKQAIATLHGDLLSFVDAAEATEWRQSEAVRRSRPQPS